MTQSPITPDTIRSVIEIEEQLALLAAEPGWKIIEARMESMLADMYDIMDESNEPNDTHRLHKANAVRKVLVTLLQMVRDAPKRRDALVSDASGVRPHPAPEAPV